MWGAGVGVGTGSSCGRESKAGVGRAGARAGTAGAAPAVRNARVAATGVVVVAAAAASSTTAAAAACNAAAGSVFWERAHQLEELGEKRLVPLDGSCGSLLQLADESVVHSRLAGEGNMLCRREDTTKTVVESRAGDMSGSGSWSGGASDDNCRVGSFDQPGPARLDALSCHEEVFGIQVRVFQRSNLKLSVSTQFAYKGAAVEKTSNKVLSSASCSTVIVTQQPIQL